jgi:hypothetical protein
LNVEKIVRVLLANVVYVGFGSIALIKSLVIRAKPTDLACGQL